MSGALGIALSAENTFASITSLIPGSAPVILGNVGFTNFECPERIAFGSKNVITTHRLTGGIRVFDIMGNEPVDMAWHGVFLSADALSRALALEALCEQGGIVPLWFGGLYFDVIIESVDCDYKQANHIPYSVKVIVVDFISPQTGLSSILGDIVNDAISIAQGIQVLITDLDAFGYGNGVSQALADLAATQAAGTAALAAGNAAAQASEAAVRQALATVEAIEAIAVANFSALGSGPAMAGGVPAANFINSLTALAQQISQIEQVNEILGMTENILS